MTASHPRLPEVPALANDDSMLSRRFGKEVINYYAGGRLNRFSFLRPDTAFLRAAASSPESRYLALKDLNPLSLDKTGLAQLTFEDVKPLIGADPFSMSEGDAIKAHDSTKVSPLIVYLGMLEGTASSITIDSSGHGPIKGQPYFAIDATPKPHNEEAISVFFKTAEEKGFAIDDNPRAMSLDPESGKVNPLSCSATLSHTSQPPYMRRPDR